MAAMAASVAVRSSALAAVASAQRRAWGAATGAACSAGADLQPTSSNAAAKEGHENQEPRGNELKHALTRKLLIKKHPPLLNPGWGKRTPLL